MNLLIITGSNRFKGVHSNLKTHILKGKHSQHIDFLELSNLNIKSCTACECCSENAECILPQNSEDDFYSVLNSMKSSDIILMLIPIYAPIPSKVAALLERLISISFFGCKLNNNRRPLDQKRIAIIHYGSNGVVDSSRLKIMTQQLFTSDYNFDELTYDFLDNKIDVSNYDLINYVDNIISGLED